MTPVEMTYRMAIKRLRTDYIAALQAVKNYPALADQEWRRFQESMQHVLFWVDVLKAQQVRLRAGLPGVSVPQLRQPGFDPKTTPMNLMEIIQATPWLQQHIAVSHGDLRQIADFVVGREKVYADKWKVSKAAVKEKELAPLYRLEMFYRHGVVQARNNAEQRLLEKPDVGDQFPFAVYQTKEDARVRPTHAAVNQLVICRQHPEGVKLLRIVSPPNGWNCVLPGQLVSGMVEGASKAFYSGPAVCIETVGGKRLTVTVNHPVLAERGWIPAQEVTEGDTLFSDQSPLRAVGSLVNNVHKKHPPTPIEQIFKTLAASGSARSPISPLEFHGDALCFDGKVDVVGAYRELMGYYDPFIGQTVSKQKLPLGQAEKVPVDGASRLDSVFESRPPSLRGCPHVGHVALDASPVLSGPPYPVCFGLSSDADSLPAKPSQYSARTHSEFLGQLCGCGSLQILPDRVLRVRRVPLVASHVYDLQTSQGWMIASGIAISNCRCALSLVSTPESLRRGWVFRTGNAKFAIHWPSTLAQRNFEEGKFPDEGWGAVRNKRVAEPTMDWRHLLTEEQAVA